MTLSRNSLTGLIRRTLVPRVCRCSPPATAWPMRTRRGSSTPSALPSLMTPGTRLLRRLRLLSPLRQSWKLLRVESMRPRSCCLAWMSGRRPRRRRLRRRLSVSHRRRLTSKRRGRNCGRLMRPRRRLWPTSMGDWIRTPPSSPRCPPRWRVSPSSRLRRRRLRMRPLLISRPRKLSWVRLEVISLL